MADETKTRKRWAVDRQQLLILLASAVMLASFVLFVLWPRHRELAALDGAVENERRLLSQQVAASHEGVYVSARIPGLRKLRGSMERRLPPEPRVAEFLQMLDDCVADIPSVTHEVARSVVPWSGSTPAVPLCLRLKGPCRSVYRGLAGIERLERLARFRRLRLTRTEDGADVVAEAEILIYYLPDDRKRGGPEPSPHDGEGGHTS